MKIFRTVLNLFAAAIVTFMILFVEITGQAFSPAVSNAALTTVLLLVEIALVLGIVWKRRSHQPAYVSIGAAIGIIFTVIGRWIP